MKGLHFALWVTTDCNLNCKYCYEGNDKKNEYMSIETAKQAIDFMLEKLDKNNTNILSVVFHGGEPTLNFDIVKFVIETLHFSLPSLDITFSSTINAYNTNKDVLTCFAKNMRNLSVSLDGKEYCHDYNRINHCKKGSFSAVINNALFLNEKSPNLRIRMTISADFAHLLYENISYLIGLGFRNIVPVIDYGDLNWNEERFKILEYNLNRIMNLVINLNDNNVSVGFIDINRVTRKAYCSGGKSNFNISPNGSLFPCSYVMENNEYSIGDIFQGIDLIKLNNLDAKNECLMKACDGCNNYEYCTAIRCRYVNAALTGDLLTPSPTVCWFEQIQLRVNKLLENS